MLQRIIISLLLLLLVACEGGSCISADDFGSPNIPMEVNGSVMDSPPKFPNNPELGWYQKSWATGTGYVLTGEEQLKFTLIGGWSPWQSSDKLDTDGYDNIDGQLVPVHNWCGQESFSEFQENGAEGLAFDRAGTDLEACFFVEGMGLYVGFGRNQLDDLTKFYHIANPEYFSKDSNGWYFTMPLAELEEMRGIFNVDYNEIRIYVLVLHYSYGDNINGCLAKDGDGRHIFDTSSSDFAVFECGVSPSIIFTSGVRSETSGFLQAIVNYIVDPFEEMVEGLYREIVGNDFFRRLITLFSTIFISYLGVVYFFGLVNYTSKDLMSLIFKFGIVYMFLSPATGWSMYQYFVEFFWTGSQELASFVAGAINEGAKNVQSSIRIDSMSVSSSIMMPLDRIIESFTSNAVQRKMLALIFSHPLGIVFYIAMMFCMFVFIMASVQVAVVVVTVYITMAILLAIGPVFFLFLLLPFTRKYFDSWLKTLIAAMLQPMLLLTFITFFATIIYDYMQRLLYYEACFRTILPIPFFDIGFWRNRGHDVFIYDEDLNEFVEGSLDQLLNFNNLFIFAIFSIFLRYMVEKVPAICDQLAGGVRFGMMTAQARQYLGKAEHAMQEGAKKGAFHFVGKPLRNLGISLAGKTALATFVKGTKAYDLRMAKEELREDYLAKGFSEKEIQKILTAPRDSSRPDQLGSQELQERYMQRRAVSELKYGKGNVFAIPGVNGAKRMFNDGLKGNYYRAKKAVTDSYTRGEYKHGRKYGNWRNNRASQKKRMGSAYNYKELREFSPAYSKIMNDKGVQVERKREFRSSMDKVVDRDFNNASKDFAKRGLVFEQIRDSYKKQGMSDTEASRNALDNMATIEAGICDRLQQKGYSKAAAEAITQKKLARFSKNYANSKKRKTSSRSFRKKKR